MVQEYITVDILKNGRSPYARVGSMYRCVMHEFCLAMTTANYFRTSVPICSHMMFLLNL